MKMIHYPHEGAIPTADEEDLRGLMATSLPRPFQSSEPWDIEMCPDRDGDPHEPEPAECPEGPVGDWLTPGSIEFFVQCKWCGAVGMVPLELKLGKIKPAG